MTRAMLAAMLLLVAAAADAALPAPPFELIVSATTVGEGQPLTLRIAPSGREGARERFDVYVLLASVIEGAFLTPAGAWSAQPVPYAHDVSPADGPVIRQWPRAWPPGRYALGLVVVPPGVDPLARADWRYRPRVVWIDIVRARADAGPPATGQLVMLAVAGAGAIALVGLAGRSGRVSERARR